MSAVPKVALQTFTIRKEMKDRKNLERIFQRVAELGITSIELARIPFNDSFPADVKKACNKAGIAIGSTQMKLTEIEKDLEWTAKMHRDLECPYCVVSVVSLSALKRGESAIQKYAERLNTLGHSLKEKGVSLLFHHHNFEFVPIGESDGFTLLKKYLDNQAVGFVFDTYWLQRSGHNPADFIRAHKGVVKGVHLRDFALKGPLWNPGIKDAELGAGNLDFASITEACAEAEVSYMAIEQNSSRPWESLEMSVAHLKETGVKL